ncbi:hypothetical protein [Chryseobacterium sp. GP-SGM7]|uniref:hypothetical protein n=1 Tax=Chryseobacterium sp. GP-SGM7 TaxID=3411323 RepID=UPI003B92FF81
MKKFFLIILISITSVLCAQNKDITGIYSENVKLNPNANYLELKSDSTFTFHNYGKINHGNWEFSDGKVLLNPKIKKEFAKITMKESMIKSDSITIKINFIPANTVSDSSKNQEFRMATVYFDQKKNYINILKNPYVRTCGWAPRIRKQHILNSNNSVTISKKDFSQIGFMTYHLKDYIVFTKKNNDSNFFEFEIENIPDDGQTIKDEFFILKGRNLYYPTRKGKINVMATPLMKTKID